MCCADTVEKLQLNAVDESLLQQTAAKKRIAKPAGQRIALLGGTAEARNTHPDLVAQRETAGRSVRQLFEAQGFKKKRKTSLSGRPWKLAR